MANTLILNQNQIWNGLGTLTYTVATTGAYNVQFQSTFPAAPPIDDGAGSGVGLGAGRGTQTDTDFCGGDLGLGEGGSGRGFQSQVDYPQPIAAPSNVTAHAATTSGLSVLVKNGASTIFTAPVPAIAQSALQFKYSFLATAADVITVVLASSTASDNQLQGVSSNVSISLGL